MNGIELSESEIEEFKVEAIELLDQAEQNLLSIDEGKPFSQNYDAIFRAFHSIKGAAGMLNWMVLQNHMHQLENHFQNCKSFSTLDKNQTSYFLKGIDGTRDLLDRKEIQFDYTFPSVTEAATKQEGKAEAPEKTPEKEEKKSTTEKTERNKADYTFEASAFVIDDEPDLVDILKDILTDANFNVEGFTSPKDALAQLEKMKPDIIVTDMKMPEISGLEVLEAVNKIDPDLPVVFVSGHLTKEMVIEMISYGVAGVIEKPFSESQITSTCIYAATRSQLIRLVNRSINFIMYQYSDLDAFLQEKGKPEIRKIMAEELKTLLEGRRRLKRLRSRQSK